MMYRNPFYISESIEHDEGFVSKSSVYTCIISICMHKDIAHLSTTALDEADATTKCVWGPLHFDSHASEHAGYNYFFPVTKYYR